LQTKKKTAKGQGICLALGFGIVEVKAQIRISIRGLVAVREGDEAFSRKDGGLDGLGNSLGVGSEAEVHPFAPSVSPR